MSTSENDPLLWDEETKREFVEYLYEVMHEGFERIRSLSHTFVFLCYCSSLEELKKVNPSLETIAMNMQVMSQQVKTLSTLFDMKGLGERACLLVDLMSEIGMHINNFEDPHLETMAARLESLLNEKENY